MGNTQYSKVFVWYKEIIMLIAFHTEIELRFSASFFFVLLFDYTWPALTLTSLFLQKSTN